MKILRKKSSAEIFDNFQMSLIDKAVGLVIFCYEDIKDDALKIKIAVELYFQLVTFEENKVSLIQDTNNLIEAIEAKSLASRCFVEAYRNGVLEK